MTKSSTGVLVIGFDPSPEAHRALGVAVDFATRLGARLHVAHVVDVRDLPIDPDSATWEGETQQHTQAVKAEVFAALNEWPGDWTYELARHESPADALVEIAAREGALMIVVGTRPGHALSNALAHVLEGSHSVSHALTHAQTPVLIAPRHFDDVPTTSENANAG